MVALRTPRAPRPSCDRYGHPVCTEADSARCEQLRWYLRSHESEVAGRWRSLYRQLHKDMLPPVPEDRLVEAVAAALQELERDPGPSEAGPESDNETRDLLKEICLTAFECHDRLVPNVAWADQRSLQEIREQLRRRLFCLVKGLVS